MGAVLMDGYHAALCEAMAMLGREPNTVFLGQGVASGGTTMTDTLAGVPRDKLIEFPVAEDLQMGTAIGMAVAGYLPVCIFPRWNFLVCAANQFVNHLCRSPYRVNGYPPKVIVRVAVPVTSRDGRFDPGIQHDADFTDAFILMTREVETIRLVGTRDIAAGYARALSSPYSTLLVEYTKHYGAVLPAHMKAA